ncbi:MAG: YgiT-type zinc finger protein [Methanophagales archaeon]|nr:YgiT-type zinc finger protein [Methanophagales archaeon]
MMEIDYENIREEDLEGEVEFAVELDRKAPTYCPDCEVEMIPSTINVKRGNVIILDVEAYKCPNCGKELLDIDAASKLEREFALRHTDEREAQEMKISFDGRDYLIRFPKALSQTLSKKSSVKLLPVSKDEFLLKIV